MPRRGDADIRFISPREAVRLALCLERSRDLVLAARATMDRRLAEMPRDERACGEAFHRLRAAELRLLRWERVAKAEEW